MAGGLGLVPLAPLGNVQEAELPRLISRMKDSITRLAPVGETDRLWTATGTLMGLRYPKDLIDHLLQGVHAMVEEESTYYQGIVSKGQLKEAKRLLLRMGQAKFGPPDPALAAAIEAMSDLGRLEDLTERLLLVSSWQELLTPN